jgi:hypothetical protein
MHAESDLRVFLRWCARQPVDPCSVDTPWLDVQR